MLSFICFPRMLVTVVLIKTKIPMKIVIIHGYNDTIYNYESPWHGLGMSKGKVSCYKVLIRIVLPPTFTRRRNVE